MNVKVKRQYILSLVGVLLCPPIGMMSLFYSGKAKTRLNAGDSYNARLLCGRAQFWSTTALIVGAAAWIGMGAWQIGQ